MKFFKKIAKFFKGLGRRKGRVKTVDEVTVTEKEREEKSKKDQPFPY